MANQTIVAITPTRTSYLLEAGPVIVNMTFLSPIEVRPSFWVYGVVKPLFILLAFRSCENIESLFVSVFHIHLKRYQRFSQRAALFGHFGR